VTLPRNLIELQSGSRDLGQTALVQKLVAQAAVETFDEGALNRSVQNGIAGHLRASGLLTISRALHQKQDDQGDCLRPDPKETGGRLPIPMGEERGLVPEKMETFFRPSYP
jgi:hypothetical protein